MVPDGNSALEVAMKVLGCAIALALASLALASMAAVPSAYAKGCIKGAVVGGVAGHVAGHHGLLGAAAGCIIGRHEANKRDRMERDSDQRRP
jgi:hypothetical protein